MKQRKNAQVYENLLAIFYWRSNIYRFYVTNPLKNLTQTSLIGNTVRKMNRFGNYVETQDILHCLCK